MFEQEIGWLLKEKYAGQMSGAAEADIERIKTGEPVAYVIGFVEFLGAKIDLSRKPLIPRPETEFWVEKSLGEIFLNNGQAKFLDIFSGSGCIGVAILKKFPEATADFVDQDYTALEQIEINCRLNNIDPARYRIIQSNIFEKVDQKYDYIFANPPYIAEDGKDGVQESVLLHEPHTALFGGKNGLKYIEAFLDHAREYLNVGGKIYLEFGSSQKEVVENILKEKNYQNFSLYQDQFQKWRYLRVAP